MSKIVLEKVELKIKQDKMRIHERVHIAFCLVFNFICIAIFIYSVLMIYFHEKD